MAYNMMTCQGGDWTMTVLGGCSQAWLVLVLVVFLVLILKRQCADGILAGTAYNFFGALILGAGLTIILTTLMGEARWSLLAGLIGVAVGGFGGGLISDSSSGGDDYSG